MLGCKLDECDGYGMTPKTRSYEGTGWNADGWDNDEYYKADLAALRDDIAATIHENRKWIGKYLRLAFHDCAE